MPEGMQGFRALDTQEERVLAGRVSGVLYLGGTAVALLFLALPGPHIRSPVAIAGCAVVGLAWGTACLAWIRWDTDRRLLSHLSTAAGLPIVAVLIAASEAPSPFRFLLLFVVVFTAYFYPPRDALAYFGGCLAVLALPFLYDADVVSGGYARSLAVFVPGLAVVGGSIAAGRRMHLALRARAAALAAEQSSLRRVATAVATGSPPNAVFALVASEVVHLVAADAAAVVKFDRPGSALLVGVWSGDAPGMETGTRLDLLPGTELTRVLETCAPVRVDDFPSGAPSRAAVLGYRATVCVPIQVHGAMWGALVVAALRPCAWDRETERRLADFADLLTTAIAETEDRARLAAQAAADSLTGLPNHRAFQSRLRAEVSRAERHGRALSLGLIDIDRFKDVNDRAGHGVGDEVLVELADRLRGLAREEDMLARTGADEFALLLPEADKRAAYAVLERARQLAGAEPFRHRVRITVSAGVCDLETAGDADALYRLADGALYWSKVHGRDVTWIYDPEVIRTLSAHERAEKLERSQALAGLRALARAIDAKDPSTHQHSERVAELAARLAEACGWPPREVARMREAALVHDVGKIGVPDAVLLKPGRLTDEEYALVQEHAELGARIVSEVLGPEQVAWVRGHHERPDGRGYPDGLDAEEISDGAALLAIADAWDAMTSQRSYSEPVPVDVALGECRSLAGAQFTEKAVAALGLVHARGRLAGAAFRVPDPAVAGSAS